MLKYRPAGETHAYLMTIIYTPYPQTPISLCQHWCKPQFRSLLYVVYCTH